MATNTTVTNETEVILYARIGSLEGLSEANSIEQQIQLDSTLGNSRRCRVRQTTINDIITHEFTFKVPTDDEPGIEANAEYTVEIDQDFFNGFASCAVSKVIKTRYVFNSERVLLNIGSGDDQTTIEVPDVKYEVDVYTKADGEISEWCKIDMEVDTILDHLTAHYEDISTLNLTIRISHLPFKPTDTIIDMHATEDQRAFIDSLWSDFKLPPVG